MSQVIFMGWGSNLPVKIEGGGGDFLDATKSTETELDTYD